MRTRLGLATAAVLAVILVVSVLVLRPGGRPTPSANPAQASPYPSTLEPTHIDLPTNVQMSAPDSGAMWALVDGRYLARSTDRGATWDQRPLPTWFGALDISFINDHEGWLLALGVHPNSCNSETFALFHTTDAGATWTNIQDLKGITDRQCKYSISFVDSNHGFINASGYSTEPVIYRTADGGRTWTESPPLSDPPGFKVTDKDGPLQPGKVRAFGPVLVLPALGWVRGFALTQYVFSSTDGGATWSYVAGTPGNGAFSLLTATRWLQLGGVNDFRLFCLQRCGAEAFETTDSGQGWHAYASDYTGDGATVLFADSEVGYATFRGRIARTVDGGHHWVWITTPGT